MGTYRTIGKEKIIYGMSAFNKPALMADDGDTICFETYDCYRGQLVKDGTKMSDVDNATKNPATGPAFIRGAEEGSSLQVLIKKIDLDETGILDLGRSSGLFSSYFPVENMIRRIHVHDNIVEYNSKLSLCSNPMIGVIGTAPSKISGPVSTMVPMDHGGNMDCSAITTGSKVYLPVAETGGLLAIGDVHALMGDGEVGNCGIEIGAKVTVEVKVISQEESFNFPVIETPDRWIVIANSLTLDRASDIVTLRMLYFLNKKFGIPKDEAVFKIDIAGDLKICQIVNPLKTVRLEFPKKLI
jgi:amidase